MTTPCSALIFYFAEVAFLTGGRFVICQNCFNALIQHDKYMEHQVFRKLGSPSLYDCASECLTSSVCLSFGFEHKTLTCFLHSNSSDHVMISPRSGFDFSDIQSWPKTLSGPCSVMSCPATTSCQVNRHGRATCVPGGDVSAQCQASYSETYRPWTYSTVTACTFSHGLPVHRKFTGCGLPPDVPEASKVYDGHYQGAVVRYTCKEDYTVCHQRNTSVCQASGQWESVAGICGKFRWKNPRVTGKFDLPCGPQSKFRVYLLATPTKPKRFCVYLTSGEDITFLSEFRFRFPKFAKSIVINTQFRHRWGSELRRPLPLTLGKESAIQMSLYDGNYKLVVDDVVRVNFRERESGMQPDQVAVEGDVFVRLMEIAI